MANDPDEDRRRVQTASADFIKRIRETEPERAYLYCHHGWYIGFEGLFRDKCEQCVEQGVSS